MHKSDGKNTKMITLSQVNFDTLILLGVAVVNAFTAYVTMRTHKGMDLLEKNTNSIKDALVISTAKASRAEGVVEGREQMSGEEKERIRRLER
jgi:hypothetical protein